LDFCIKNNFLDDGNVKEEMEEEIGKKEEEEEEEWVYDCELHLMPTWFSFCFCAWENRKIGGKNRKKIEKIFSNKNVLKIPKIIKNIRKKIEKKNFKKIPKIYKKSEKLS
jgi:hypothetical protein